MTVERLRARLVCIPFLFALAFSANVLVACDDYILSEEDLSKILDDTLGALKPFVTSRSVRVEQEKASCYLKMQISVEALAGAVKCTLSACSIGVADNRRLGINSFHVNGCDQLFNFLAIDRNIKTVYTDASKRIIEHCGTEAYRISSVVPQRSSSGGFVRLVLTPIP